MTATAQPTCVDRVEAFLAAVGSDPLRAWVTIDASLLRAQAGALDELPAAERAAMPLFGMLVAVKDNFDTVELPTTYGSPICAGHRPQADAAAVALLRRAGALIAGKTALAEFASMHPPATRNPLDPQRTPGGSSSGSAAAVAAGHVPVATGTQTAGSVVRPGSYCGVIALKPTFGLIATGGIKPLAPSLDTVGIFSRRLEDGVAVAGLLAGHDWLAELDRLGEGEPRIAFARTPLWDRVDAAARDAVEAAARALTSEVVALPEWWVELADAQARIQLYEGARSLAPEHAHHRDLLSRTLREILDAGAAISAGDYGAALALRERRGPELSDLLSGYDALLVPSTTGVPPQGLDGTGDPLFSRPWQLIGAPAISLPLAWSTAPRLPVGVQLVAAPHTDGRLWRAAAAVLRR